MAISWQAIMAAGVSLGAFVLFACGSDPASSDASSTGEGAGTPTGSVTSGEGATSNTSPASNNASSGTMMVTNNSSSGSGSMFDCDPPAMPGSLWELEDTRLLPPLDTLSMCEFRGDVLLIFNSAAI